MSEPRPRYAAYYCEENVWWLAREPRFARLRTEVAVITNERGTVRMRAQRAGEVVIWDYHVVLAVWDAERGVEVWDLDCTVGIPLAAARWMDASFDPETPAELAPRFRVLSGASYVATFASDRRHMRGPDGSWQVSPPPWPAIGGGVHHLQRFVHLGDTSLGEISDLGGLRTRWR